MAVEIRVLETWEGREDIEPRWEELVQRNCTNSVFLGYAWLRTWWRHFGGQRRLLILLMENAGELIGAAPLMLEGCRLIGSRATRVRFAADTQAYRTDLLAAPERRDEVMAALADYLVQMGSQWDLIDLKRVLSDSPNLASLERELRARGVRSGRIKNVTSPYVALCDSWDEQKKQLSGSMRYNLSRKVKRLEREANSKFISLNSSSDDASLERYFAIAGKSWQGHLGEYSTIASSPRMRAFYEDLWEVAGDRKWRAGGLLEINGDPAAFAYCLTYHGRIQFLKTGYDPGFSEYSPGMLLVQFLVREACETGKDEFDFYGSDESWKLRWTHLSRGHVRWLAYNRGVRPRAAYTARFEIAPRLMRVPGLRRLKAFVLRRPAHPTSTQS